ncbi:MAG TPA: hypothetical protein VIK78_14390 [Ruminiclostridium sp.]
MKRLSITLTDEAMRIYESWKPHDRSRNVSQGIIKYEIRTSIDIKLEQLENRIDQLENQKI